MCQKLRRADECIIDRKHRAKRRSRDIQNLGQQIAPDGMRLKQQKIRLVQRYGADQHRQDALCGLDESGHSAEQSTARQIALEESLRAVRSKAGPGLLYLRPKR